MGDKLMAELISRRKFLARCGRNALLCAGTSMLPLSLYPPAARGASLQKGFIAKRVSPYFTPLGDKTIRCDLCPHACEVEPGERGLCEVRENIDGSYYTLTYGNPCSIQVDPIEKKPFFHVLPTTRSFSLATAGCNFSCKFCQNWEISQARPEETYNYALAPKDIIRLAQRYQCRSIASTYVEPTIFIEYMLAIARLAKTQPVLKVMHSNGFINSKPLADLCRFLDAACIDLKSFTEDFYREMTDGRLAPVLATLKQLRTAGVHTEIVNLVIPGKNDNLDQIRAMCRWIQQELGPDTPLHFSRFYPRYRLKSVPRTPVETLDTARKIAMDAGLRYVYIGNVANHPGEHTYCPGCQKIMIERVGYRVTVRGLADGRCKHCGREIAGIWNV